MSDESPKPPDLPTDTPIRYLDRQRLLTAWYEAQGLLGKKTKRKANPIGALVAVGYAAIGIAWSGDDLKFGTLRECDYDVIEYGEKVADLIGDRFSTTAIVQRAKQLFTSMQDQAAAKDQATFS